MRRVYFSSTSYNCTEAVAISHTLRNDNKLRRRMAGILGGSMYFSHHVLLRISSFLKKKNKLMEKDAYLVLLKKEERQSLCL